MRRRPPLQTVVRSLGRLAVILVLASRLAAQTGARFDHQVQAYVHNGDFSGSVLVARDGHILFEKSYGMANYEWGIANSEKTKFHIASVTKTFTAAAILQLERAGKLKLNDPLSKYVPDFLNGERITIEQMLTHTSGLAGFLFAAGVSATQVSESHADGPGGVGEDQAARFLPGQQEQL